MMIRTGSDWRWNIIGETDKALPPADDNLIKWLTLVTLATGLLLLVWKYVGAPVRREWLADREFNRRFRSDWDGTDGRPGHHAQPGVMESLHVLRLDGETNSARLKAAEAVIEQHTQQITALRADVASLRLAPVTREEH